MTLPFHRRMQQSRGNRSTGGGGTLPPSIDTLVESIMEKLGTEAPDGKTYLNHIKNEIKTVVEKELPGHFGTARSVVVNIRDRANPTIQSSADALLEEIARDAVVKLVGHDEKDTGYRIMLGNYSATQLYNTDLSTKGGPAEFGCLQATGVIEQAAIEYRSKNRSSPGRG